MIIKFFSTGIGGGAAPVDYLITDEVLAYDENRNLIRDDAGQPQSVVRNPLPEVIRGNPDQTRDLIDASTHKWTYTSGVISFADSDQPSEDEQQEAIDRFEKLAFAGLDADQYDCLWVRHTHEGNVELHFCTPRLELTQSKSLNIAPPGHESAFNSLRDLLNQEHGWADPLEPDRARDFKPVRENAERAAARTAIISALYDQIDGGLVTNRQTMIDFFEGAGFEVTRRAEKSISVRDPEFTKPFKLEGVLTHENWTASRHAEIAAHYQAGKNAERTRRLDAIPYDQLCTELAHHIEKRQAYNRERYGSVPSEHLLDHHTKNELDAGNLSLRTLGGADDGFDLNGRVDRDQPSLELANAPHTDDSLWFNQNDHKRSNLSDPGYEPNQTSELHSRRQADHMYGGTRLDAPTSTDSVGTRINWLRRTANQILSTFSESHDRFRKALDYTSQRNTDRTNRLRNVLMPITTALTRCTEVVAERVHKLRAGRTELNQQLATVTERRNTVEEKLKVIRPKKFNEPQL